MTEQAGFPLPSQIADVPGLVTEGVLTLRVADALPASAAAEAHRRLEAGGCAAVSYSPSDLR